MSSVIRISFISSFLVCMPFISLCCHLILSAKISSAVSHRSGSTPSLGCAQCEEETNQSFSIKCNGSCMSYSLVHPGWRWRFWWIPLALKLRGDGLPINLALPWLCTVCVLLDRRGGPAPCGAHQHPHREGPKAPPASAKQISYYHMVQGGWVFRKVFCSIRLPFLILSLGAVSPLCLSVDSGSRVLQLPIWETPKAKQKQGTQCILVHLPELLCSPSSSTHLSESTREFVVLYPRVF